MRFKEENWQPTIGDMFILVASGENVLAMKRSDANNVYKLLKSGKMPVLTTGYVGIQSSSKYMIAQYRKSRDEFSYKPVVGETTVELLKDKQLTYRYGDE